MSKLTKKILDLLNYRPLWMVLCWFLVTQLEVQAQYKVLKGEGTYQFSTEYTFNVESYRESDGEIRIYERNNLGQTTKAFTVYNGDTSTIFCRSYDAFGNLTAHYDIYPDGKIRWYETYEYTPEGLLLGSHINGVRCVYQHDLDSNIYWKCRVDYRRDTLTQWTKTYYNELLDPIRILTYDVFGKQSLEEKFIYDDGGVTEKRTKVSYERFVNLEVLSGENNLLLRLKEYPDGRKDTVINRLPVAQSKKSLVQGEYAHYNGGYYPDYSIQTFPNGLTSKIRFYGSIMEKPSTVFYTLNEMDKHKARHIFEYVYAYDFMQYRFVNILTGEEKLVGKPSLKDYEIDIPEYGEKDDADVQLMPREYKVPEVVYHLGNVEIDTVRIDKYYGPVLAYRSYLGYVEFSYDEHGNLTEERVVHGPGDNIRYQYNDQNFMVIKTTEYEPGEVRREEFDYYNEGQVKRHATFHQHEDSFQLTMELRYDRNGNQIGWYQRGSGGGVTEKYENTRRFLHLGKGLAHSLRFQVDSSGYYQFSLEETAEDFALELATVRGKVLNPNRNQEYSLGPGVYEIRVANKEEDGNQVYKLKISRNP
jgi:hypothetical protein